MPQEYVVRWSGGSIGAGASVFHFTSVGSDVTAQPIANAVRAMFDQAKIDLPSTVTLTFDTEVREISNTGALLDVYPVSPGAAIQGTGAGIYAAGTGGMVRHVTGVIAAGRRLQGRTFIVPLDGDSYTNSGTVLPAVITRWGSAFATMRTSLAAVGTSLAVWSRTAETTAPVIDSTMVSRVSALRSRNDRV